MPDINIPGLVSLVIFYLLILFIGLLAAWLKTRKGTKDDGEATVMVAGREIGLLVGVFTMTATWVGGGYINGTAEVVYTSGILHAQAPVGYALSLMLGGLLFAQPMRKRKYLTMLDPFQEKYGKRIGGLLYLPALCGELFWSAAILNALGSSVSVIMNLDFRLSVVVSACVAVLYTFFGGLYSVAFTDVVQLICIAIGLTLCVPFAWYSKYVCWGGPTEGTYYSNTTDICLLNATASDASQFQTDWLGSIPSDTIGKYIDTFLLLIFGGIPWQVYFQRVLSVDAPWKAQALSFAGAFGCLIMSIPPALAGIIAGHTNWDAAGYGFAELATKKQVVLPLVMQYLTPVAVAFFGLGAISAAVMSSSDSSILSASSMFAHNIYKLLFRQQASQTEVVWVLRAAIVVCGILATIIGLLVPSVYGLWTLCSDFVYVILFPQLLAVIYLPFVNSYGVLAGYFLGLFFRLLGGEETLSLSPAIPYPTNFPFKTFSMFVNLITTVIISAVAIAVFQTFQLLPSKFDVLHVFPEEREVQPVSWQKRRSTTVKPTNADYPMHELGIGNPAFRS